MTDLELKRFVYVSIISADNNDHTEDIKQEILARYDEDKDVNEQDWEYVLAPLKDTEYYQRYLKILTK